ncbi:LpqB family beta-propeller domain-containing protein [Kitasatospora sp. NBC_01300]|uniref:LpqB family beta-propeller domain-containing protein n=1 Tax=Kitasatospora sp. NBC_01300 TaxID=2903574 RepID=UPI00352E4645|nr:LpqB family beta-propeller domain-containing protein [Kitasatospora sp. NBC_01300]
MRRTSSRTEPRFTAVAGVVLGALVASGCAAMPDSGGISRVELSQGAADKNLQAKVYPVAPAKGAKPRALLTGFLDAVTADEGYETARQYLTENASAHWNPDAGIQVLSAATPNLPAGQDIADTDTSVSATVTGSLIARIDEKHSYLAEGQRDVSADFTLVREKDGEWRIDRLPAGVIMNETNFNNSYRQVDRYFYTTPDPSSTVTGSAGQQVLIPDPIYLRRRIDPLTAAAKALVAGPSTWLAPVARTSFPSGVSVDRVSVDDGRIAHVQLGGADVSEPVSCRRMATQLFYTLADQGKGQVERLELKGQRGNCFASRNDLPATGPGALAGPLPAQQYYQRADNGLLMVTDEQRNGEPVRGVLGKPQPAGKAPLGTMAVNRDGSRAAAISGDGHQLYSVPLADSAVALPDPVLTSPVKTSDKEDGLASPSWDGRGDLWVVDRNPQGPRVVMVRGNRTYPVAVEGLDGQTVQALKISSDGARAALVVKTAGVPSRSLYFGLVVHGGTPEAPTARITGLRRAAPSLTDVASVSWAEADQLLVLGKEADRIKQLYYIGTDGTQSADTTLQAENMLTVSASESRGNVLAQAPSVLAAAGGAIYRLIGSQWREVQLADKAGSFFYAG